MRTTADNYVEIKIKADDTAKPDLTDLKAKLAELGAKVETAKVDVDDKDAAAKLLALNAKLAALDKRVTNPRITVAGAARVEADIASVDAALKHLDEDTSQADKSTASLRSRLLALGGAAGSVTGVGDAMSLASGDASMFQKVMAGASLATGLLEPAVAGVTVAAGGLAAGAVAAGAGLGVFGLVAKSVYGQVSTAVKSFETAQNTTGKASAAAMKRYQAEMAALPPAQQAVAKSIIGMQTTWQNFVQDNTAGVGKIMSQGIGLLPKILSAVQPLLAPVEKALSGIIGQLSHGLDSSGFKSFMASLTQNTGPAITKIADAIGHVVVGIGGILKAFMPVSQGVLSGVDAITKKFAEWGSSLSGHSGFESLMSTFKTETPLVLPILKNLAEIIKNIGGAMAGLATGSNSKALLQMLGPVSGVMASLSKNTDLVRIALYALAAKDIGSKIHGVFTGVSGGLKDLDKGVSLIGKWGGAAEEAGRGAKLAAAGTKIWSGIQAAFNIIMDANPIMLIVIGIALLVAAIIYCWTHFKGFRDFWKDAWKDIKNWAKDAWTFLKRVFDDVVSAVENMATGIYRHFIQIRNAIQQWVNDVKKGVSDAVSWFKSLPGRILSALGNLGSLLYGAGQAVLQGLLNGIESMVGGIVSAASHVGSSILSSIKGALGLGSPSRITHQHGVWLAQGLIEGMDSMHGSLNAAAGRLAGGAIPGRYGTGGAGGGAQRLQLEFVGSPTDPLLLWLRNSIRVRGGNVQAVLGH